MTNITKEKPPRILLVGGGTGGPTTPLLAVAESIRSMNPSTHFLFVGTSWGPERHMAEQVSIPFVSIPAGKFRRYFSLKNIITPFQVIAGFIKSLFIIRGFKPTVVFGAGSFVQVPLLWASWVMRVPVAIHQQDIVPTLANVLCSPIAQAITVTFELSAKDFSSGAGLWRARQKAKVTHTGNPLRESLRDASEQEARAYFGLSEKKPVLFVTGGGGGAQAINDLVWASLDELTKYVDVIHGTGKGKRKEIAVPGYVAYEFIDRMDLAYAASDIVLCRAGISTITELANLGKIGIIIPMPNTHQEENAVYLGMQKAAIIGSQNFITPESLVSFIRNLLLDGPRQKELVHNIKQIMPHDSSSRLAQIILEQSR
jgi:UDP-N-acetylglucosamine--N-acetylmuramyl-(pentapeptide) pyrophosphoryl-undecaprenol N-acetylglucosamine transferase